MKKLIDLIKFKLLKNRAYPITALALVVLERIDNIIALINKFFFTHITISILVILFILFFSNVFKDVESNQSLYSKRLIKFVKIGKYLLYLLLLIPGFYLYTYVKSIKSQEQLCNENKKKTGLLIANFTEVQGVKDGFTSNLFGKLNADLQNNSSINLRQLPKFITENDVNYLDTIKNTFSENCSNSGLIVFGNSNYEKSFNCRIYSYNYLNFATKGFSKTKDSTIIYIQNPDIIKTPHQINFTIDDEASVVSDFILGLLFNHEGNYNASTKSITKALKGNTNPANNQFLAFCHLFIGNNSFKQKNISNAITEYKAGILSDSVNDNLHYNLAVAYRQNGKIMEADSEYKVAQDLNKTLKNPLHEIRTLANNNMPMILKSKRIEKSKRKIDLKVDTGKKIPILVDWEEHCFTIKINNKYGVINNMGDTIVSCQYDDIESYPRKNADCYILKLNNKYGAIIHVHSVEGYYTKQLIPIEYSIRTIYGAVDNCVDNHY